MSWNHLAAVGGLIWGTILLLPWKPWGTCESVDSSPGPSDVDLADITALIPARNEATIIAETLSSLRTQGLHLQMILVDDQSTDGTGAIVQVRGGPNLPILTGEPLPGGWSGKLWALEQGFRLVTTPLTLLVDADIRLEPGILRGLREKMREENLSLISLMARMRMVSFWEKLLMPAFVYFFKMLYPFRLSNSTRTSVAAAAGGCILLETRLIREVGGFEAIRRELIDDCALAKRVKARGYRTWIGLTHSVQSLRSYDQLSGIWQMVSRTAFCQLRYSIPLLVGTTIALLMSFWLPVAGLAFPSATAKAMSLSALAAMIMTYLPTLRFYGRSRAWAFALPLITTLYLAMTWSSMIQFWFGSGSSWKDRSYRLPETRERNL